MQFRLLKSGQQPFLCQYNPDIHPTEAIITFPPQQRPRALHFLTIHFVFTSSTNLVTSLIFGSNAIARPNSSPLSFSFSGVGFPNHYPVISTNHSQEENPIKYEQWDRVRVKRCRMTYLAFGIITFQKIRYEDQDSQRSR